MWIQKLQQSMWNQEILYADRPWKYKQLLQKKKKNEHGGWLKV
jgi:hypothetical protein